MGIRKRRIYPELPEVTPVSTTKILVTDATTGLMGFSDVSALLTTVDGNGLATDADIATLNTRINAVTSSIGVSGSYASQDIYYATNNGNGTNFKVGDDVWIGDVNRTNTMQIAGVQNPTQGFIKFGSGSSSPSFGYGGSNDHVDLSCALKLNQMVALPTATVGTLAVSGSHLFFHNGSTWNQVI